MDSQARVRLQYTGTDEVSFAGSVNADPRFVTGGAVVTVDAWAVPAMLENGVFVPADESQEAVIVATELRGAALDEALTAAGLPTTGKADEKRTRLAEHLAAEADDDPQHTKQGA